MATQTQLNIEYYAKLLILQYLEKARAAATIAAGVTPVLLGTSNTQFLKFSAEVSSGTFKLSYNGVETSALNWNDSAGTIETALGAILPAPMTVTVTGSIALGLTFEFDNIGDNPDVQILAVTSSTLDNGAIAVVSSVAEQLPLSVQNAFNLIGPSTAVGVQLDVIGKYAGVSRNCYGFNGPITLDDSDFFIFIQMAILRNRSGSSLATIQALLHEFFAGVIYVFDYENMNMSYLISTTIGSQDLIQAFVAEGLLPRPMGVGLSVIAAPIIDKFFAFRTYEAPAWVNTTPFQTYDDYHTDWLWLSYQDSVPI